MVISRVTSWVAVVITYTRGLVTPLIATHEPPRAADEAKLLTETFAPEADLAKQGGPQGV